MHCEQTNIHAIGEHIADRTNQTIKQAKRKYACIYLRMNVYVSHMQGEQIDICEICEQIAKRTNETNKDWNKSNQTTQNWTKGNRGNKKQICLNRFALSQNGYGHGKVKNRIQWIVAYIYSKGSLWIAGGKPKLWIDVESMCNTKSSKNNFQRKNEHLHSENVIPILNQDTINQSNIQTKIITKAKKTGNMSVRSKQQINKHGIRCESLQRQES